MNFSLHVCRVRNFPALHQHSKMKKGRTHIGIFPAKKKIRGFTTEKYHIRKKTFKDFSKIRKSTCPIVLVKKGKNHPNTRENFLKNLVFFQCEISNG